MAQMTALDSTAPTTISTVVMFPSAETDCCSNETAGGSSMSGAFRAATFCTA